MENQAFFGGILKDLARLQLSAASQRGDGPAELLRFDTQEEALLYAARIARLQPGDRVKTGLEGKNTMTPGVFLGMREGGGGAVILEVGPDNSLRACSVPWGSIFIPG